jgi:hypothetical protein
MKLKLKCQILDQWAISKSHKHEGSVETMLVVAHYLLKGQHTTVF